MEDEELPDGPSPGEGDEPRSVVAIAAIISGAWMAVWAAPFLIPNAHVVVRWPYFVMTCIALVMFWSWLPDAWHYRREDKGGLAFVLILVGVMLWSVWHGLSVKPVAY